MIICLCRNIRDSDYSNKNELIKRLYEEDKVCGICLNNVDTLKEVPRTFMGAWAYFNRNKRTVNGFD